MHFVVFLAAEKRFSLSLPRTLIRKYCRDTRANVLRYTPAMNARRRIIGGVVTALLFWSAAGPVHAQVFATTVNDARLVQLYQAYLTKGKSDAYLEKRIAEELKGIRKQIDTDIKAFVAVPGEDQAADSAALSNALERQRGVVASLESAVRESRVDTDLLEEEERKYYADSAAGTGTVVAADDLRTTGSYAELLAKKAILGQRIESLETTLAQQTDRLDKLSGEQRFQQFRGFFDIGWYVLIITLAVISDRVLREVFVGKIERNKRRYLATKIITAATYGIAIMWIGARLLDEHPGAFASLAIVGAGIAVALQSIVKDLFGWLVIIQRRYYAPGDRITIGQFTGDVVDIGPLRTAMLEVSSTLHPGSPERSGKMLYIPNSLMLSQEVLNFHATSEFVQAELKVTITPDSNWRKAENMLLEIVTEATKDYVTKAGKQQQRRTALHYLSRKVAAPAVDIDATDLGYTFTLSFTVPIGSRRDVVTALWRSILEQCEKASDIRLAFHDLRMRDVVARG
jgi:small-conductance mechanosensitive channel